MQPTAHISGSTFFIDVASALLPSEGLAPGQYLANLWPRDASVAAGNSQIADFAPDNSDLAVSPAAAVPEPETYALFASGLAALAALVRRRRRDERGVEG